ncbi:MAG: glycosyltransferase family 2 protein [Pseudomonadales bacterium]
MKIAIAAIVKNEAEYLLEWIAYHRVIGVSHFLIANNDSTDETPVLLQQLQSLGIVTTINFPTTGEKKPQLPAYQKLTSLCPKSIDLIAFIDADEYLTLMDEAHTTLNPVVNQLFTDPATSAVAMNWACFGSAGHLFRDDGMVIERFHQQSAEKFTANLNYKTIVRRQSIINFRNPHHVNISGGAYLNSAGEPLAFDTKKPGVSKALVWDNMRVNHYVTKSLEEFVVGKSRNGSAATKGRIKHKQYFKNHDRNEVTWSHSPFLINAVNDELKRLTQQLECTLVPSRSVSFYKQTLGVSQVINEGCRLLTAPATSRDARKAGIYKWHLDSPADDLPPQTNELGWLIRGWLLAESPELDVKVVVKAVDGWEWQLPLTSDRPDVTDELKRPASDSRCGFSMVLPRRFSSVDIFAIVDSKRILLRRITLGKHPITDEKPRVSVIKGETDYLFLDNDSNGSVDQACGLIQLSNKTFMGWRNFLNEANLLSQQLHFRYAYLWVPGKEIVCADQYPYLPSENYFIDRMLAELPSTEPLVYPVDQLKGVASAYLKTDTHWTHAGALEGLLCTCAQLGLDRNILERVFSEDPYQVRIHTGDLGNKTNPPTTCEASFFSGEGYRPFRVFDNGMPNTGRMIVMENPATLYSATCLIFGASSSYSFLNYAYRIFEKVIFIHNSGSLDPGLLRSLQPQYVISQTNARFVVKHPTANFSHLKSVKDKWKKLSPDLQESVREKIIITDDVLTQFPFYAQFLPCEVRK